jgi:hypothetical protein
VGHGAVVVRMGVLDVLVGVSGMRMRVGCVLVLVAMGVGALVAVFVGHVTLVLLLTGLLGIKRAAARRGPGGFGGLGPRCSMRVSTAMCVSCGE